MSFVDPNLHRALLYPFIITRGADILRRHPGTPANHLCSACSGAPTSFICLLLLPVVGSVLRSQTAAGSKLFSLALFSLSGLARPASLRNVPIFALLAVPLVAVNIQQFASHADCKPQSPGVPSGILRLSAICYRLSCCCSMLVFTVAQMDQRLSPDPVSGMIRRIFPVGAADCHELRNNVPGPHLQCHGIRRLFHLDWYPEHKVYIDGRLDVYGSDLFATYGRVFWSAPILDSVIDRYDLNCFVLPQPPSNTAATQNYIGRTLAVRRTGPWSISTTSPSSICATSRATGS